MTVSSNYPDLHSFFNIFFSRCTLCFYGLYFIWSTLSDRWKIGLYNRGTFFCSCLPQNKRSWLSERNQLFPSSSILFLIAEYLSSLTVNITNPRYDTRNLSDNIAHHWYYSAINFSPSSSSPFSSIFFLIAALASDNRSFFLWVTFHQNEIYHEAFPSFKGNKSDK